MSAPAIESQAPMIFVWDRVPYNLAEPLKDRHGTTWTHTGEWEHGEPPMRSGGGLHVMPLPDLYRDLLPLRPQLTRPRGIGALLDTGRWCADCGSPCPRDRGYCSPQCRNRDDYHDTDDHEDDD